MGVNADILDHLTVTIRDRKQGDASTSYTAQLFARGTERIAKKLGEEAVELALAAVLKQRKETANEAADLLFHLMVLLEDASIPLEEVFEVLRRREGISGIAEKAARKE